MGGTWKVSLATALALGTSLFIAVMRPHLSSALPFLAALAATSLLESSRFMGWAWRPFGLTDRAIAPGAILALVVGLAWVRSVSRDQPHRSLDVAIAVTALSLVTWTGVTTLLLMTAGLPEAWGNATECGRWLLILVFFGGTFSIALHRRAAAMRLGFLAFGAFLLGLTRATGIGNLHP